MGKQPTCPAVYKLTGKHYFTETKHVWYNVTSHSSLIVSLTGCTNWAIVQRFIKAWEWHARLLWSLCVRTKDSSVRKVFQKLVMYHIWSSCSLKWFLNGHCKFFHWKRLVGVDICRTEISCFFQLLELWEFPFQNKYPTFTKLVNRVPFTFTHGCHCLCYVKQSQNWPC